MGSIIMRQTEATIRAFETFKSIGKLACHFVYIVEEIGGCVLFRARGVGAWFLLPLQRSL
jgi:hypothetical protein